MAATDAGTSARLRQRALFAALYFAEGAPIGLIWWALPAWWREADVPASRIALVSAWVTWPWTLKVLIAPLVDRLRGPRFGLRAWLLLAQVGMLASLLPLAFAGPGAGGAALVTALVVHAAFAATQDVVIDGLAIRAVDPAERGGINGWMQTGMLAGRALFGGGAILFAERVGTAPVVWALMAAVGLPSLLLFTPLAAATLGAPGLQRSVRPEGRQLLGLLRSPTLWWGCVLASVVGAGFEVFGGLAGPYLIDRGASTDLVGSLFLAPTVLAMACGALLGGRLSDRLGRWRAALVCEALAAVTVLAVGLVDLAADGQRSIEGLVAHALLCYVVMGMATSSVYALLMDLTDRRVAATQFAAFMGGINLCYVWSAAAAATLLERGGYGLAFSVLAGVSLLGLLLFLPLRRRVTTATDEPAR